MVIQNRDISVLLLAIWLTTMSFLFLQKATIKFLFHCLFGCICIDFPYINAFLPLKEVKNRITTNSNKNQLLEKKINFEKRFKIPVAIEIANKFHF